MRVRELEALHERLALIDEVVERGALGPVSVDADVAVRWGRDGGHRDGDDPPGGVRHPRRASRRLGEPGAGRVGRGPGRRVRGVFVEIVGRSEGTLEIALERLPRGGSRDSALHGVTPGVAGGAHERWGERHREARGPNPGSPGTRDTK